MKGKTIKRHIIKSSLLNVIVPVLILGIFAVYASYQSAISNALHSVEIAAEAAAERARWEIRAFENIAVETGGNTMFSNPEIPAETKAKVLNSIAAGHELDSATYIDENGIGLDGNSYADRAYYQTIMNGASMTVSEPLVSKATGKMSVVIAAPTWKDGVFGGTPDGCICMIPDVEFLNEIVRDIRVSENSAAYILNASGTVIADVDASVVAKGVNYITQSKAGSFESKVADVHRKMIALEMGADQLITGLSSTIIGYAPIPDTDGWSIAVAAPGGDFLRSPSTTIALTLIFLVLAIVGALVTSTMTGNRIGGPVSQCTERILKLSEGDLKSPVPEVRTSDETKVLADATTALVENVGNMITDIGQMLSAMASGDFTVQPQCPESVYCGDFHILIDSVQEIIRKLNAALSQINVSADQVFGGAGQMAGEAQSLAQIAIGQAQSVERLSASIQTIESRVVETAENCRNGKKLVDETVDYMEQAASEMGELTAAMAEIDGATGEIGKIIKTIEDIAFQTNILALNAAVEAARAGSAGKGFAVVADEVRNLATKSAEAAQTTTALIERTVSSVSNGASITAKTAEAVSSVGERASEVKRIVDGIADANGKQAEMIETISNGITQLTGEVGTTSASAEESAASAQELSGLAETLKAAVNAFRLKS